jgi:hypothetical protein
MEAVNVSPPQNKNMKIKVPKKYKIGKWIDNFMKWHLEEYKEPIFYLSNEKFKRRYKEFKLFIRDHIELCK